MEYIIGIDGGGTKTKGYISDGSGNILGSAFGDTSNYLSAGIDKAEDSLNCVITKLCEEQNIQKNQIGLISLGLAGAGREKSESIIRDMIKNIGINGEVILNNDAYIALVGAHGKEEGIITISGTGSISLGSDGAGNLARVGGWGHILGDEGSGYYFAREGLIAVLKHEDGRGNKTVIKEKVFNYLSIKKIDSLIEYVYNNLTMKNLISDLSPLIIESAEEGDIVANTIVDKGLDELIAMTSTIRSKLGETKDVALAGGVFEKSQLVKSKFI